jgi:hypothetical protein
VYILQTQLLGDEGMDMDWRGDETGLGLYHEEEDEEEEEQEGEPEGEPEEGDAQQWHRAHLERDATARQETRRWPAEGDVEQCRRARLARETAERRKQRRRDGMPECKGTARLDYAEMVTLAHMFCNHIETYWNNLTAFYKDVEHDFYGKYVNAKRCIERWTERRAETKKEEEGSEKSGSAGAC